MPQQGSLRQTKGRHVPCCQLMLDWFIKMLMINVPFSFFLAAHAMQHTQADKRVQERKHEAEREDMCYGNNCKLRSLWQHEATLHLRHVLILITWASLPARTHRLLSLACATQDTHLDYMWRVFT